MVDTELHDEHLCPADKVAFGLASANRDETIFDDPHTFRLDRPDARAHLAFGGGPHVCPGANLARLEGQIAIGTLVTRFPKMSVATSPLEVREMFNLRGLKSLPVTLR